MKRRNTWRNLDPQPSPDVNRLIVERSSTLLSEALECHDTACSCLKTGTRHISHAQLLPLLHITMRSTSRLLANVKSAAKYLEPNTPTGLTGLTTHPAPRPALIYTYRQTLNKLSQLPSNSVYRQSTEALTKHRLEIVESTKPTGYDAWLARVQKQIDASPAAYEKMKNPDGSLSSEKLFEERTASWDGEFKRGDHNPEGPNLAAQAEKKARAVEEEIQRIDKAEKEGELPTVEDLEAEPPLDAEQYVGTVGMLVTDTYETTESVR